MIRCSVCKSATGGYYWPAADPADPDVWKEYPLYQRGYVKDPQKGLITCCTEAETIYISPRCSRCYDKAVKKAERKQQRRIANV